ncbi:proline dehydrogenase family protein [bacterium]|nr:proline dehydrogenase family protein [bacterium]
MQWFNRFIVWILPIFPKSFIWLFSRRYIAGQSLLDGIEKTKELNQSGCCATIDVLGEDIHSLSEATLAKEECMHVLDTIQMNMLDSNHSLKLTQLGLKIDKKKCFQNVKDIVQKAKQLNNFVRIDMEDSTCTTDTLEIYRKLRKTYNNVGAVIQAYLMRSQEDVRQLIEEGIAHLRICKGIYDESPEIAYKDREKIKENYIQMVEMVLDSGGYVGIATHDRGVINRIIEMIRSGGYPSSQFEFQMLLGVTEHLRKELVSQGYRLRVYVPYGDQWYGYCTRRLKENPQVAGHIIKNIFIRK